MWKRIAALVLAAVVLLAAVVIYRTETYEPPAAVDLSAVNLAPATPVNAARAARSLSAFVRASMIALFGPSSAAANASRSAA